MAGPRPPNYGFGAAGPPGAHPGPTEPIPGPRGYGGHFPGPPPSQAAPPFRGPPPPLTYPEQPHPRRRRRRSAAIVGVAVVALMTALAATIVYAGRDDGSGAAVTERRASTAIQDYLDALSNSDIETIARNSLCGIYDAVRERRSDDAVAKLNSDAFRKQFSEAEVTSVDKIVHLSEYQAQVLFTMRVVSAAGDDAHNDVQGIAQVLATDHRMLVCSYVLHTSGTY